MENIIDSCEEKHIKIQTFIIEAEKRKRLKLKDDDAGSTTSLNWFFNQTPTPVEMGNLFNDTNPVADRRPTTASTNKKFVEEKQYDSFNKKTYVDPDLNKFRSLEMLVFRCSLEECKIMKEFLKKAVFKKSAEKPNLREILDEDKGLQEVRIAIEEGYQCPIKEPEVSYSQFKPPRVTINEAFANDRENDDEVGSCFASPKSGRGRVKKKKAAKGAFLGQFEDKTLISKDIALAVARNKVRAQWLEERFRQRHRNILETQGWRYLIDRNKIIWLKDLHKTFVKEILNRVRENINSISAAYYVRQVEQFPHYTLIFKRVVQDRPLLSKMRQQSHAFSIIDSYLNIANCWNEEKKVTAIINRLAIIHAKYNLSNNDHRNHYIPLINYLRSSLNLEMCFVTALLFYFSKVSLAIIAEEKVLRTSEFVHSTEEIKVAPGRPEKAEKQCTWD